MVLPLSSIDGLQERWDFSGGTHQGGVPGPQAFRNVVRRMLEASGRGMWNASQDKLEDLQSMLNDIEDQLEGIQ